MKLNFFFFFKQVFISLFIFMVLGFELTALHSLGSCSTTGATPPALNFLIELKLKSITRLFFLCQSNLAVAVQRMHPAVFLLSK
jgi:hypothetical protein